MRRLALVIAGGAIWLLLAAVPALADGGPHVATINNGTTGITADSCAGCHRAHTAQAPNLLVTEEEGLCLSCHGSTGTGATTDVETGVQYALGTAGQIRGDAVLGALRGGGFLDARIGSGMAYRLLSYKLGHDGVTYESSPANARIPVSADSTPVTSAHIALPDSGFTNPTTAWGNGANGTGAGPEFTGGMECTTCHNPHGNGNYRILRPIPTDETNNLTKLDGTALTPVNVLDDTTNSGVGDKTRNYTVIQVVPTKATTNGAAVSPKYLLTAADVGAIKDTAGNYGPLSGDYLHKSGQYNASGNDAPNGLPATFFSQMTAWCEQCHTRYDANHATGTYSGDPIFAYKHTSNSSGRYCLTCHVSHGSNAVMNTDTSLGTTYSGTLTNPDGTAGRPGDSRLLKVDNRGTCLLCHDPTEGSAFADFPNLTPGETLPQGPVPTLFP